MIRDGGYRFRRINTLDLPEETGFGTSSARLIAPWLSRSLQVDQALETMTSRRAKDVS
jgi:hypothetical protein